eukprot:TRINITY_DN9580_c0_g1_i5.p1 TRINITY_DN9580_c0_g1~~TRINITY_DN9580_c0_g1_i5.p1  ORF type:complete len:207 (-),score=40.67 TRINITY_DN9580_c0_g1_i5:61-681(-)
MCIRDSYCSLTDDDCENNRFYYANFEVLFKKYGVDLFLSGEYNYYERFYPAFNNTKGVYQEESKENVQVFTDPDSPIHVTIGGADVLSEAAAHGNSTIHVKTVGTNSFGILSVLKEGVQFTQHGPDGSPLDRFWIRRTKFTHGNTSLHIPFCSNYTFDWQTYYSELLDIYFPKKKEVSVSDEPAHNTTHQVYGAIDYDLHLSLIHI